MPASSVVEGARLRVDHPSPGHCSVRARISRRPFQARTGVLALIFFYASHRPVFADRALDGAELVNNLRLPFRRHDRYLAPVMVARCCLSRLSALHICRRSVGTNFFRPFCIACATMPHLEFLVVGRSMPTTHGNDFQRALSAFCRSTTSSSGSVGLTILVFYHPYFLLYIGLLLAGFNVVFFLLSHGGLKATIEMSHAKYETLHWMQEISYNLLHFKATDSQAILMRRTDELVGKYLETRQARFSILIRQYLGSVGWQAVAQSGLIATAGWLVSVGQLTLGQLVAAEVVVSVRSSVFDEGQTMGLFLFPNRVNELAFLSPLPKDQTFRTLSVPLPTDDSRVRMPANPACTS